MKYYLFLTAIVIAKTGICAPIYKSTDNKGNVTYSSKPIPNASKVTEIDPLPNPSEKETNTTGKTPGELEHPVDETEKQGNIPEQPKNNEEQAGQGKNPTN